MYDLDSLKYWTLEQMCSDDFKSMIYPEIENLLDNLIKKAQDEVKGESFESGYESGWADAMYRVNPPI